MMKDKNRQIIEEFRKRLREAGLENKLDIEPIESPCKVRQPYGMYKDGIMRFAVKLWDLNKLDDQELSDEIDVRIER